MRVQVHVSGGGSREGLKKEGHLATFVFQKMPKLSSLEPVSCDVIRKGGELLKALSTDFKADWAVLALWFS